MDGYWLDGGKWQVWISGESIGSANTEQSAHGLYTDTLTGRQNRHLQPVISRRSEKMLPNRYAKLPSEQYHV